MGLCSGYGGAVWARGMISDYDMIVIGAGAAGLVGAGMSALLGAKTALVEAERLAASVRGPVACRARRFCVRPKSRIR